MEKRKASRKVVPLRLHVATILPFILLATCQCKTGVGKRSQNKVTLETKTSNSGTSSASEEVTLSTIDGSVVVPAGAFTEVTDVSLDELSSAAFLKAAELATSTPIAAGPMQFASVLRGTSTPEEPQSALSVRLYLSSADDFGPDTAGISPPQLSQRVTSIFKHLG